MKVDVHDEDDENEVIMSIVCLDGLITVCLLGSDAICKIEHDSLFILTFSYLRFPHRVEREAIYYSQLTKTSLMRGLISSCEEVRA
jgi:hypothetical protein